MIKVNCKIFKGFFKREKNGFAQVGIEVADESYDKFNEMRLLFVTQKIPDCNILEAIKMHKKKIIEKQLKETKKLLGVMKVSVMKVIKILL